MDITTAGPYDIAVVLLLLLFFTISLHHAVKERYDTWSNPMVEGHGFGPCFRGGPFDVFPVTM